MVSSVATQVKPAACAPSESGVALDPQLVCLQLEFSSDGSARKFMAALASLLYGAAESCVIVDASGCGRDDLDFGEINHRVKTAVTLDLQVHVRNEGGLQKTAIELDETAVRITTHILLDTRATGTTWLQANPEHLGPVPVLALSMNGVHLAADALHPLVGLGVRTGGLIGARLHAAGESSARSIWTVDGKSGDALPVIASHDGAVWIPTAEARATTTPELWFEPGPAPPALPTVPAKWWTRFDHLTRSAATSLSELESHLRDLVPYTPAWRLDGVTDAWDASFMVPAEEGVVMALLPKANEVVVAVDLHLPAEVLQPLLLHAVAHLVLGHVRPGDDWGHWDTKSTATSAEPHRHWDREAKDFVARHLRRHTERRVESLDDCTPTEKAQLALWRIIGEMLGESRRLDPVAERYQKAAYQRQAAQRIVAMLEDYGGAMLCDGVGLGKTYVATTLMVHYVNSWRKQWASTPERLLEDPFRITVLAPNSVVSTWRREALPALTSFGVPLVTVRVVSHTKLSRISSASAILEPVRGGLSDLEHLLISDLVVVDEAHNFRSLAARRTKVLRDLLRLQPRREIRRRVALLTATTGQQQPRRPSAGSVASLLPISVAIRRQD